MKQIALVVSAALLLLVATQARAGDAEAGKAKTATCVACHGNDGKGTAPNYPNIGGQNERYLIDALKGYKSGARNNPIMKPMVAALSDADIENVAAYYASLPCQ